MSKPLNYIKIVNILTDEQFELEVGSFNLSINENNFIDLIIKSINDNTDFNLLFPDFREKQILNLRYFIGKTQMEVSNSIGISQAQVSRLEKNALNSMKKYLEVV